MFSPTEDMIVKNVYLNDSEIKLKNTEDDLGKQNDELSQLVFEYLEINGLEKTLSTFIEECRSKSLPYPDQKIPKLPFMRSDGQKLLDYFDNGGFLEFTKLWDTFMEHIKVPNEDMQRLEVYLRVYFTMYPFKHNQSEATQKRAMLELKYYFEDETNNFPEEIRMLPLFALPYLQDTFDDPVFQEILHPAWTEQLRYQLETTIFRYFFMIRENSEAHAKYATVLLQANIMEHKLNKNLETTQVVSTDSTNYYQNRFYQLISTFRKIRRLLRGTRESYGKLLKVALELVVGLESAAAGQIEGLEPIINKCYNIFPELFTPDGKHGKADKEYFKQLVSGAIFDTVIDSDVSLFFIGISDISPSSLDFKKIKETLASDDRKNGNRNKLVLLQALRWLVTRSPRSCKAYAMDAFISCDILGLKDTDDNYRNQLFSCLILKTPTYLKECLVRFLSCFSSLKSGRRYLSSSNYTIDMMLQGLQAFDPWSEKYNCQVTVATLQKLSLLRSMRLGMIERGGIQWLVSYMKPEILKIKNNDDENNANVLYHELPSNYNLYLMEYGWALIMNLCLHKESSGACVQVADDLFQCIIKMLRVTPLPEVVTPFVISTLFSLIQNPATFPIAIDLNIRQTLTDIMEHRVEEIGDQLGRAIRILNGIEIKDDRHRGDTNYNDEEHHDQEELETELEIEEGWVKSLGTNALIGDDLLTRKYLKQKTIIEPIVPAYIKTSKSRGFMNEVLVRPTTPSKMGMKNPLANSFRSNQKMSAPGTHNANFLEPSGEYIELTNNYNTGDKSVLIDELTSNYLAPGKFSENDGMEENSQHSFVEKQSEHNSIRDGLSKVTVCSNNTETKLCLPGSGTEIPNCPTNGLKKKKKYKMHRETSMPDHNGNNLLTNGTNNLLTSSDAKRYEEIVGSVRNKGKSKNKSTVEKRS